MAKQSQDPRRRHRNPIPFLYRFALVTVEPLFALNGCYMLLSNPMAFLAVMSPLWSGPDAPDPSSLAPVRVLTDQLAAMQLLFAFTEAFVLRMAPDLRTWRLVCVVMLLSDVLHISASLREVFRHSQGGNLTLRGEDWLNFSILGIMAALRVGVLLGIGIHEDEEQDGERVRD